jgi:hypothetical protein
MSYEVFTLCILLVVISVAGVTGYVWPLRQKPTLLDEYYNDLEQGAPPVALIRANDNWSFVEPSRITRSHARPPLAASFHVLLAERSEGYGRDDAA